MIFLAVHRTLLLASIFDQFAPDVDLLAELTATSSSSPASTSSSSRTARADDAFARIVLANAAGLLHCALLALFDAYAYAFVDLSRFIQRSMQRRGLAMSRHRYGNVCFGARC